MELWASLGVSFVAEQTFYRGVSEPDVALRLAPRCVLVNTAVAPTQWRASNAASATTRSAARARLRKLRPLAERLQSELSEPLAFGCPLIVVDTDDGYTPTLQAVLERIDEMYSRPLIHDLDRPAPPG